ncbi:hypothetical protein OP10G_2197 [Fimbriimonas ginsengisoli Gsoil 348]|uniref:Uncharacterized protein n=1 Tax=Fimbriimonas ginsengisoli Gsoil 348 TaxID=661478 RepID=A0A068NS55_FIMGI|nr:hypothetical protein OP10G_2197 [Fimbriimonas ginsengisoli Gsoil 348]
MLEILPLLTASFATVILASYLRSKRAPETTATETTNPQTVRC